PRAYRWKGGASFDGFIDNIRTEALERVVSGMDERAALNGLSRRSESLVSVSAPIEPEGPVRVYTVDLAYRLTRDVIRDTDLDRGRALFAAVACRACHRINGVGGGVGLVLSGACGRCILRDLFEIFVQPSLVISESYSVHMIDKTCGSVLGGSVVAEEN